MPNYWDKKSIWFSRYLIALPRRATALCTFRAALYSRQPYPARHTPLLCEGIMLLLRLFPRWSEQHLFYIDAPKRAYYATARRVIIIHAWRNVVHALHLMARAWLLKLYTSSIYFHRRRRLIYAIFYRQEVERGYCWYLFNDCWYDAATPLISIWWAAENISNTFSYDGRDDCRRMPYCRETRLHFIS